MTTELTQRLQEFVGRGGDFVTVATDRVTAEAIRQAANVVGDRNPGYRDTAAASGTPHGGLVAPPSSVLWWHRAYLEPVPTADTTDGEGVRRFRLDPNPLRQQGAGANENGVLADLMQVLAQAGFGSIVVTNAAVKLARYPRPGDLLSCCGPRINAISALKQTALGAGYFSTSAYLLSDELGDEVATWETTRFHFAPKASAPQPAPESSRATRVAEPCAATDSRELFPPWIVEVTTTLVMAGAVATRDIQDVHHDRELAQCRGFNDIFLNNFTSMALVSRYVTDWAGSDAVIRSFSFKLSKPQYPGDQVRFTGTVLSERAFSTGRQVEIHVVGDNSLGNHIACTLLVEMRA